MDESAPVGLVREWVVDLLLAVTLAVLAVGSVLVPDPTVATHYPPPNAALVGLALAASLPLALRRRWPSAVFAVSLGSWFTIDVLLHWNNGIIPACVLFALYAAASWQRLSYAIVCLSLLWSTFLMTTAVLDDSFADPLMYISLSGFTVVWAAGLSVRKLRHRQREAVARALEAERTRAAIAERAVFAERLRIARELHDVVSHTLSVIAVQSGVARHLLGPDQNPASPALAAIEDASRTALDDLRRMLGVLRAEPGEAEASLDPSPGLDELELLASAHRATHGPVDLIVDPAVETMPESLRLTTYRLVQEALTNVRQHAPGAHTHVRVGAVGGDVEVQIDDDGGPHPPSADGPRSGGYGLVGMRERVAMFGGSLDAGRRKGGGFRVRAVLHTAADRVAVP